MADDTVHRVRIRHNVVAAIEAAPRTPETAVPDSKLDVTAQLAANNMANGCIDGDYFFDDVRLARHFAKLSLDYARRLIERSEQAVAELDGAGDGDWHNPFVPNGTPERQ